MSKSGATNTDYFTHLFQFLDMVRNTIFGYLHTAAISLVVIFGLFRIESIIVSVVFVGVSAVSDKVSVVVSVVFAEVSVVTVEVFVAILV